MWFPKLLALVMFYVIAVNLFAVFWGWFKEDAVTGVLIAVVAGSGVGIMAVALITAIWILMDLP